MRMHAQSVVDDGDVTQRHGKLLRLFDVLHHERDDVCEHLGLLGYRFGEVGERVLVQAEKVVVKPLDKKLYWSDGGVNLSE